MGGLAPDARVTIWTCTDDLRTEGRRIHEEARQIVQEARQPPPAVPESMTAPVPATPVSEAPGASWRLMAITRSMPRPATVSIYAVSLNSIRLQGRSTQRPSHVPCSQIKPLLISAPPMPAGTLRIRRHGPDPPKGGWGANTKKPRRCWAGLTISRTEIGLDAIRRRASQPKQPKRCRSRQ